MLYEKKYVPILYGVRTNQVSFEAWGSALASGYGGVLYLEVTFQT